MRLDDPPTPQLHARTERSRYTTSKTIPPARAPTAGSMGTAFGAQIGPDRRPACQRRWRYRTAGREIGSSGASAAETRRDDHRPVAMRNEQDLALAWTGNDFRGRAVIANVCQRVPGDG